MKAAGHADANESLILVAAATVTLVSWAGAYVAITIAAREMSPAPFALARLASAALILLLVSPLVRKPAARLPRRRDLPGIALMALMGFPIYHTALNAGQESVAPGAASLLIGTLPIFASIIAQFVLGERMTARAWFGIAVSFCGVALLVLGAPGSVEFDPRAMLILLAALSGAVFMVTQRFFTRRYDGFSLTIWGIWMGAVMLSPYAPRLAVELAAASMDSLISIAYLGLFPTALAYVTWSHVLKTLPAARAASLLFLVPPMTFVFAWLLIDARPSWLDVLSGLIIVAGIALVQRAGRRPQPQPTI